MPETIHTLLPMPVYHGERKTPCLLLPFLGRIDRFSPDVFTRVLNQLFIESR
jgi:hypothetical protein